MKKILIIEDEKVLAEMYQEKLEKEGFKVLWAFDVKEGIELAKREKPDLILLDILLAGENGISFLKKQKEIQEISEIPVIAFSNFDDPRARKEATELGVKEYLVKTNYTPRQIIEKIGSYLRNK
jgi:DNA-binding response OmpR family regulator